MAMSTLLEQFAVQKLKEEGIYSCNDYLSNNYQISLERKTRIHSTGNVARSLATSFPPSVTSSKSGGINEAWRQMICEWTFQVIDHFDFNREIASISLNYLDRYLSTRLVNRKIFQLAAMTSLFLAVKLYGPNPLKMSSFVELSRGYFQVEHIRKMEGSILWALSWRVHPPTPLGFVRYYLLLLGKSGCTSFVALEINEIARYLTELSTFDYFFTTRKPSSTGLGAVLTAFERFDEQKLPSQVRLTFLKLLISKEMIDPCSDEVQCCKRRLQATYHQEGNNQEENSEVVQATYHQEGNNQEENSEVVQASSDTYEHQHTELIEALRAVGRFSPDSVTDVNSSHQSRKRYCNRMERNGK